MGLTGSWEDVAQRKREARSAQLGEHVSIIVPDHLLPKDPPTVQDGPQNVLDVARKVLEDDEYQITEQSVSSLLSSIRTGKLSAVEVTRAFCRRASVAQQLTNCITEPLFGSALRRARDLDDYYARKGKVVGPLHGLPVSVKDTFNVKGVDSSIGIASLCFKPTESNAPLVDLLLSLGCVIVAKTNVPQTLASLDSVNNVFGRTMNPANRLCTAGGSSGGEGVLVAMKGCALGWGTDIGGSIRIPAMCNNVYGFKPSHGRIPYGGQAMTGTDGMSRTSIQAVAGPIARSVEDIDVVMGEVVPRANLWGEDCVPSTWHTPRLSHGHFRRRGTAPRGSGPQGEFVVGVLRSDGNCQLLPPISKLLDEVADALRLFPHVKVVELPSPPAWTRCQSVMNKLMGVDGATHMADLLEATGEPLVPWMATRFKRGRLQPLDRVAELQAQRTRLDREMLKLWVHEDKIGRRTRKIDAVVCPVAPHPVPMIDRYNAVGYTSSWVLLDCPAGTVPVRSLDQDDLELGKAFENAAILGSWDEKNRELWDETMIDRKVYLGTSLSVQVVTSRLEDEKLTVAMDVVDAAVRRSNNERPRRAKI